MPDNHSVEENQTRLLRQIAAQDREAIAEFYDQTAPALYSLAWRMLGDAQDAEEVVQDVFLQIWNKARTFDPAIGQPFHWAMSIARNRCIDRLRARQRRFKVLVDRADGVEIDAPAESASEGPLLADHELEAVRCAVGLLAKSQRQAIEMAFFGGLTHQEIADTLHEPLGTIKARIRRGMLKLGKSLRAYA